MMKRVFLLLCVMVATLCYAAQRTPEQAAELAAQFTNNQPQLRKAHKVARTASDMKLVSTRTKRNSTAPAFYVFNQENNAGYVVVAGDDLAPDVLVYSEQGQFNPENVNPNFQFWLNRMQEEMSVINEDNALPKNAAQVTAIGPLLLNKDGEEIAWYQEEPYWNQCPMDLWKTSERCLTGCVATAAAQIMYKWRYPETGTGSHSYTWECCMNSKCSKTSSQVLSKDFSTVTFDWDNMLATYNSGKSGTTAQKNAVATLMSCCGIACDMEYGGETIGGSGAWTDDMGYGLITYFGYKMDKFISTYSKKNYQSAKGTSIPIADSQCEWSLSTTDFTSYFNADLEAGRPILMGGEDSDGGHEFVCDGRNSSGYFHINWGWEGESNNYCLLTALKPSGSSYDFSSEIDAIIGLEPAVIDTVFVTGVTVAPTTLTLKIKEKSTLTASVVPTDATVKTISWFSSDPSIATVDAKGLVTGVAAGAATITVTTKDGNKKATCAITVSNDTIEITDCDKYDYEFTTKCSVGDNTLGEYSWNISLQAGSVGDLDSHSDRGQQFGSKNTAAEKVSLTTSEVAACTVSKVVVEAAMGSSGDGQLAVYINNTQVGSTQSLTSSSKEYTFTNSDNLKGDLEIRLTNTKKALYVKAIHINPQGGGGGESDTISLSVNYGWAQYEASEEQPWTIVTYQTGTREPWIQFYFDNGYSDRIAGQYDLADAGAIYWPDDNDDDNKIKSVSGSLVVTCVGVKTGASDGCNEYLLQATFAADDGNVYLVKETLELCGLLVNGQSKTDLELQDEVLPTILEALSEAQEAPYHKFLHNGHLFIEYNGTRYAITGEVIR